MIIRNEFCSFQQSVNLHVKHSALDPTFASFVLQQAHPVIFPFTDKCISWSKLRTLLGNVSVYVFLEGGFSRRHCILAASTKNILKNFIRERKNGRKETYELFSYVIHDDAI